MAHSVTDLIEMARALSEGDFDREFQQLFHGELGELASYLDAVRQSLRSISTAADASSAILPAAANGVAEIRRESEMGFNSVWKVIESMQDDQASVRKVLASSTDSLSKGDVEQLRDIANKSRQTLLGLMSYLSFQDVLRQRLEKVEGLIETLVKKTMDLMIKFNVKTNRKALEEGDGAKLTQKMDLDQNLVDELLASLK